MRAPRPRERGGAHISGVHDLGRLVDTFPYDDGEGDDVPDDVWKVRAYNVNGVDEPVRTPSRHASAPNSRRQRLE